VPDTAAEVEADAWRVAWPLKSSSLRPGARAINLGMFGYFVFADIFAFVFASGCVRGSADVRTVWSVEGESGISI
jgi:hypothetical protein